MCEAFERAVITHCAPTLAGHKCASLFTWREEGEVSCADCVREADAVLSGKGVRLCVFNGVRADSLVYVYRPAALERRLHNPAVREFLKRQGYEGYTLKEDIEKLSCKVAEGDDFPHEIGIFLDYPLEDVEGFIENRGQAYCCLGVWKVYSNEQEARRRFQLYRKCREVYLACYERGFDVKKLTVTV